MTAEVVALPGWQMCECGAGVACHAIPGGFRCFDCAERLKVEQACASAASIMLSDPGEKESLDDLLARLVQP